MLVFWKILFTYHVNDPVVRVQNIVKKYYFLLIRIVTSDCTFGTQYSRMDQVKFVEDCL